MATQKFKQPSPYTVKFEAPPEDIKYQRYLQEAALTSVQSTEKIGFALFGVGRAGTIHLSFLIKYSKIELLYIIEDNKSKWKNLKRYWNLTTVTFLTSSEADVVFKDSRVRAVVVASPTHTHEDIVMKALSSNKGVFCEKPVAGSYQQTKSCYAKAKEMNQPLLSAFNRRFDPSFASIKERVRKGEVGKVLTVKVCSRDSPLPTIEYLAASGKIFHDCAVHDIDMIINILGEFPTKVMAMARANIKEIADINDFDTVGIMLWFESGALGIIDLSRHAVYGYDQRLEVFGDKGMIKAENLIPTQNVESYSSRSVSKAPILYSFPSRYADSYEIELLHFLDVLQNKAELAVNSSDTLAVTKIATACEKAVETGKYVLLDWTHDE